MTQDLKDRVAALSAAVQDASNDRKRLRLLSELVVEHEALQRVMAGLPQHHARNLQDLYFPHSEDIFAQYRATAFAVADRYPANKNALASKVMAMICGGDDRTLIEETLASLRPHAPDHIFSSCTFDAAFYERCRSATDREIGAAMPPVNWAIMPPDGSAPILLLACDHTYFTALTIPLLRSLSEHGGGAVHLHLMDCDGEKFSAVRAFCSSLPNIAVGLTVENPGVAKKRTAGNYYHAARFVRLYQLLKHYNRPLWLMDVDALFNRPPSEIFERFGDADVAFRARPGRLEPWNQFNACMVGAAPTEPSLNYFRMIAAFIANAHRNGTLRWGIDQFAMYGVYDFLAANGQSPSIALLDEIALDYVYRDEGVVWCNSGADKIAQIRRPPGTPVAQSDPRAKYIVLFDRYRAA